MKGESSNSSLQLGVIASESITSNYGGPQNAERPPKRRRNLLGRSLYVADWTDSNLAERIGISRSRINRIKNGRVVPTVAETAAIARALGKQVDDLF